MHYICKQKANSALNTLYKRNQITSHSKPLNNEKNTVCFAGARWAICLLKHGISILLVGILRYNPFKLNILF